MSQEHCHVVNRHRAASVLMELVSKGDSTILINQRNKGLLRKAPLINSLLNCGPSASLAKDKREKYLSSGGLPSLHVETETYCFAISAETYSC